MRKSDPRQVGELHDPLQVVSRRERRVPNTGEGLNQIAARRRE